MKKIPGSVALALLALLSVSALARQTLSPEQLRSLTLNKSWTAHTHTPRLDAAIRIRLTESSARLPDLTFDSKPELQFVRLVKLTPDNVAILEMKLKIRLKNVGRGNFDSEPSAQSIRFETVERVPRQLARVEVPDLPAGEGATSEFTETVQWTQPLSDEFPKGIQARLTFNPDIYIDGNSQNDDANLSNNQSTLRGADLRTLINNYVTEQRGR